MSRAIVLAALLFGSVPLFGTAEAQPAPADRYGAAAAAPALEAPASGPQAVSTAMRGRMLSWPGKSLAPAYAPPAVASQARVALSPPQAYTRPAPYVRPTGGQRYAGVRPDEGAYSRQGQAGSDGGGWRAVYAPPATPALAGTPARAALPTSIYSPGPAAAGRAAAAPPPVRTASADRRYGYDPLQDHSVHFYSVHRPFGLQPDPAPIPPQFFANTADLSEPPGPLPGERTTGSSGAARTVRAAPDTSVQ